MLRKDMGHGWNLEAPAARLAALRTLLRHCLLSRQAASTSPANAQKMVMVQGGERRLEIPYSKHLEHSLLLLSIADMT